LSERFSGSGALHASARLNEISGGGGLWRGRLCARRWRGLVWRAR
jgi:hypothetical protein